MTRERAIETLTILYYKIHYGEDQIQDSLELEEALEIAVKDLKAIENATDIIDKVQGKKRRKSND